ncbi:MAG: SprT family zinc-dependent metalloprotease [Gammaproteobacteria bacterium]|nr:SprT family zinc-dependent metalloprotease [Gammaproteobacteria bacterium]
MRVLRKPIRHLYIRVDPTDGSVRVSAPIGMDESAVQRVVESRQGWIERQRQRLAARPGAPYRAVASGEIHYVQGRPCRLDVVEGPGRPGARLIGDDTLELNVKPGADPAKRHAVLERWYRRLLGDALPALIERWEPTLGVRVAEWRIKRMKTRWGTCNIRDRRIWMNLALARKPPECLEYVLVHEMVHLLERRHNARFHAYMDRFMPDWRVRRARLVE